jgi:hypothetical protein
MSRRALVAVLLLLMLVVPLAVLRAEGVGTHPRGDEGRAGSEEVDDDALTAERLDALAKARANGTFGGGS